jgi:hypothetical protein
MFVAVATGYGFFGFRAMPLLRAIAGQFTAAELAFALRQEAPAAAQQGLTVTAEGEAPAAAAAAAAAGFESAATGHPRASWTAAAAAEADSKTANPSQSPQRSPLPAFRWQNPVELFAKELQLSVRGMCAATADALANTTELGGVRHSSLAGLKQWLAADEGNEELLRAFLHEGKQHSTLLFHRIIR